MPRLKCERVDQQGIQFRMSDDVSEGAGQPAPGMLLEDLHAQLPPENQELLSAVMDVAAHPETDRSRLHAALVGATYLVPLARGLNTPPAKGEEVNLEVLTLTGPDGKMALPVFTHPEAIVLWNPQDQSSVALPGAAVFQMAAQSPMDLVAINPAGPFGGNVPRAEFEAYAQGLLPGMNPAAPVQVPPQNVYLDLPLEPLPEQTRAQLCEMFENSEAILEAYLFLLQVGETGSPDLTLGVLAVGSAAQWVEKQLQRFIRQHSLSFDPYPEPHILLLEALPDSESVRQTVPAMYRRDGGARDLRPGAGPEHDAEDVPGTPDLEREERMPSASRVGEPKRRSLWPFGRR